LETFLQILSFSLPGTRFFDNCLLLDYFEAIGTGGNIAKLLNLSKPAPEEKSMSFDALFEMAAYVGSFSFEDRVNKLRLNTDRADVIVPAASIYLTAMELGGCKTILVPDLGLKDGIIQMLYDRHLNRKK
jgi:exopolyphosphatase/guanosine-5'-triphosphate,3'-diphosphate pyrophosphatase